MSQGGGKCMTTRCSGTLILVIICSSWLAGSTTGKRFKSHFMKQQWHPVASQASAVSLRKLQVKCSLLLQSWTCRTAWRKEVICPVAPHGELLAVASPPRKGGFQFLGLPTLSWTSSVVLRAYTLAGEDGRGSMRILYMTPTVTAAPGLLLSQCCPDVHCCLEIHPVMTSWRFWCGESARFHFDNPPFFTFGDPGTTCSSFVSSHKKLQKAAFSI